MSERRIIVALSAALLAAPAMALERDAAFLVETICRSADGTLLPAPLVRDCAQPRARTADDVVGWQRHDWPAATDADRLKRGYQRSISYLARGPDGGLAMVQTFDFGGGNRRFGHFDAGRGDGGQVVIATASGAHITMTEDGSGGAQWFAGSACRGEREPLRSGWLLFGVTRGPDWQSSVASLRIAASPAECPAAFDRSYTRWRERNVSWPLLIDGEIDPARPLLPAARTILSEHFGGATAATADHMERFFLSEGMGLTRWERWEHAGRTRKNNLEARSAELADSGRCQEVEGSEPPGEGWQRVDCRMWTNFVPLADRAAAFDWREARR